MTTLEAVEPLAVEVDTTDHGLQSVRAVAERERARLEAAAGRTGPARWLARLVPGLRHLGSEEAARNGLRYQPAAWTLIAIAAIAILSPGRDHSRPAELAGVTPTTTTPTAGGAMPTTTAPALGPAPTLAPSPAAAAFRPPAAAVRPSSAVPTTTAVAPTITTTRPSGPTSAVPLSIAGAGWADSLAGTPLAGSGVPDGTLPVGNRLGRIDRATFARLRGTDTRLVLQENTDGRREQLGSAAVMACPITTTTWTETEAQSFADAPRWDDQRCVPGARAGAEWTFDLSSFTDRAGPAGVALVPAADAPADFQVTFQH